HLDVTLGVVRDGRTDLRPIHLAVRTDSHVDRTAGSAHQRRALVIAPDGRCTVGILALKTGRVTDTADQMVHELLRTRTRTGVGSTEMAHRRQPDTATRIVLV